MYQRSYHNENMWKFLIKVMMYVWHDEIEFSFGATWCNNGFQELPLLARAECCKGFLESNS